MTAPHPIQRRFLAEDLIRLRPASEQRRYVASQRSAKIDPNPHQIDAVLFALQRIPEGGCILADEVGLGKTIEAGLVIAQLLAEGAERVLLVTPKSLLGQWRQELFTLFSINATEYAPGVDLAARGVFLVSRDFIGGEKGADLLLSVPVFDLCVVDEAHEIFSNVYRRFDRQGNYMPESKHAKKAGRARDLLRQTPLLLLTATPIQNSLTELWGLVHFVEPTDTLFGDLGTFRAVFCAGGDRRLAEGQEHELRRRTAEICQRTLRRQAQEFMKQPFVGRRAKLFEYTMSREERVLYDSVTAYLLEPILCAFRGNNSRLLLIGFHRRMASSVPALTSSLEKVAARLEKLRSGALDLGDTLDLDDALDLNDALDKDAAELLADLEDDDEEATTTVDEGGLPPIELIEAELERVRGFIELAKSLPGDSKAQALARAVRVALERADNSEGSGKLVVFTESLTTQEYLRRVLREHGVVGDEDITLFRGTNEGPRVRQALARWKEEILPTLPPTARPSKDIALRDALVHEFRTRSKVFISTEAGAKGLNLQFADTLINYDLPWNPQRIEQRIGRIHRYGQVRDVTVITFIAKDNEAQRLTFEILAQKLDLFGTVLDASDVVLYEPSAGSPETLAGALGANFESDLRKIYERARSLDDITTQLAELRESMAEERTRFEEIHKRTAGLIESHFDEQVKKVFRRISEELPIELAAFDRDIERVVTNYLAAIGAGYERRDGEGEAVVRLEIEPHARLPEGLKDGVVAGIGNVRGLDNVEPLHLGHPLVQAAIAEARQATEGSLSLTIRPAQPSGDEGSASPLRPGRRGKLRLAKVRHEGFERVDELLPVVVFEDGGQPEPEAIARAILAGTPREIGGAPLDVDVTKEDLDDALEELLFVNHSELAEREQARFSSHVQQIEGAMDDRERVVLRQHQAALEKVESGEHARDAAIGAEARTKAEKGLARHTEALEGFEAELARLRARDDEGFVRWMGRAHARRSRPPSIETLFEAEFELE